MEVITMDFTLIIVLFILLIIVGAGGYATGFY